MSFLLAHIEMTATINMSNLSTFYLKSVYFQGWKGGIKFGIIKGLIEVDCQFGILKNCIDLGIHIITSTIVCFRIGCST